MTFEEKVAILTSGKMFVRYADDSNGRNITETYSGQPWVGLYFGQVASSVPSDYNWMKLGGDGVKEYEVFLRYRETPTSTWSEEDNGQAYIGVYVGYSAPLTADECMWFKRDICTPDPVFTGATSTTDGTSGNVPSPSAGDNNKFLRGDGTWAKAVDVDEELNENSYNPISNNAVTKAVSNLEEQINGVDSANKELKEQIDGVDSSIKGLEEQVDGVDSSIGELTGQISDIDSTIEELTGQINDVASANEKLIFTIEDFPTISEDELTTIQSKLNSLKDKSYNIIIRYRTTVDEQKRGAYRYMKAVMWNVYTNSAEGSWEESETAEGLENAAQTYGIKIYVEHIDGLYLIDINEDNGKITLYESALGIDLKEDLGIDLNTTQSSGEYPSYLFVDFYDNPRGVSVEGVQLSLMFRYESLEMGDTTYNDVRHYAGLYSEPESKKTYVLKFNVGINNGAYYTYSKVSLSAGSSDGGSSSSSNNIYKITISSEDKLESGYPNFAPTDERYAIIEQFASDINSGINSIMLIELDCDDYNNFKKGCYVAQYRENTGHLPYLIINSYDSATRGIYQIIFKDMGTSGYVGLFYGAQIPQALTAGNGIIIEGNVISATAQESMNLTQYFGITLDSNSHEGYCESYEYDFVIQSNYVTIDDVRLPLTGVFEESKISNQTNFTVHQFSGIHIDQESGNVYALRFAVGKNNSGDDIWIYEYTKIKLAVSEV